MKQKRQIKPIVKGVRKKSTVNSFHKNKKVIKPYSYQPKKKKYRKIRYGRLLIACIIVLLCFFLISKILKIPIRNIYIIGNTHLSDQEIIELAQIQDYPSYVKTLKMQIEKRLEGDARIVSVTVKKKKWKEIYIEVVENIPLYYNQTSNKTILADLSEINEFWSSPVLLNYIPDTIYEKFKQKMQNINEDILIRVSEIMYQPNNVDEERFLFTMNDGNYVYLTLETFEKINNYVSIYAEFTNKHGDKKGILNLDSGQFFTILE